uniref:Uncharacterized protein n=1 Tax=Amphimedon queenslandica TaxID=400682 RepID=A0A1X7T552_AMPQE
VLQGDVLSKVEQNCVKKNQTCGEPHYRIFLGIENCPVVGIHRPEEVCSFIQDRIICHILDIRDSCINDVENSLKLCKRNEKEVRVNNYNPLLLKLWHANMDLQYIAERSLSLREYVTVYVTEAEKNHALDLWDEVSSCNNMYSRLLKISQKLLRAKEV